MKTVTCDRCGKKIYRDPMQQAVLPMFTIYVTDNLLSARQIDLCDECDKALYTWLKGADDE